MTPQRFVVVAAGVLALAAPVRGDSSSTIDAVSPIPDAKDRDRIVTLAQKFAGLGDASAPLSADLVSPAAQLDETGENRPPATSPADATLASSNEVAQSNTALPIDAHRAGMTDQASRVAIPMRSSRPATGSGAEAAADQGGGDGSWVLRTLGSLGVVIVLILLLRTVIARWNGRTSSSSSQAGVEVLSRVTVGPRQQIVLVRMGTRILVLADSAGRLNMLTAIDDPEEVAATLATVTASRPTSVSAGFASALKRFQQDYRPSIRNTGAVGDQSGRADRTDDDGQGLDDAEIHVDRARDQLSGLLSRLRSAKHRQLAPQNTQGHGVVQAKGVHV